MQERSSKSRWECMWSAVVIVYYLFTLQESEDVHSYKKTIMKKEGELGNTVHICLGIEFFADDQLVDLASHPEIIEVDGKDVEGMDVIWPGSRYPPLVWDKW